MPPWEYSTIFVKPTSIGTPTYAGDSNGATLVLYVLDGSEEFATKQCHTSVCKHFPRWAYATVNVKPTFIGEPTGLHDSNGIPLVLYGRDGSEGFATNQCHTRICKHVPPCP